MRQKSKASQKSKKSQSRQFYNLASSKFTPSLRDSYANPYVFSTDMPSLRDCKSYYHFYLAVQYVNPLAELIIIDVFKARRAGILVEYLIIEDF